MKMVTKLFVVGFMLSSSMAFAQNSKGNGEVGSGDISSKDVLIAEVALETLLNTNPKANDLNGGEPQSVNSLLAKNLTSRYFYDKGQLALAITTNTCKVLTHVKCSLVIGASERKVESRGSLSKINGSTEGNLMIQYTLDQSASKIVGEVEYSFAD